MDQQRFLVLLITSLCLLPLIACGDPAITATAPFYAEQDVIYDSTLEGRWILYGDNQPMAYDDHESWDPPIKLIFEKPYSIPTTTTDSQSEPKQKEYKLTVQTLGSGNDMKAVLFQRPLANMSVEADL